ncbi:MAG: TRAP transporter small permease subunit [Parvularculaceae bacterium]
MLTLFGDILNWLAAGIVLPLMFLPLAALLTKEGGRGFDVFAGSFVWGVLVSVVLGAGVLFVKLAPRLDYVATPRTIIVLSACIAFLMMATAAAGGPRKFAAILAPLFETVTRGAGRIVMWLILAMALVQFAVVILRYVFGLNFIFMQESLTYMHGAVFLIAAGYALVTDDHVRVDIFYRGASPKQRALIDFAGTYLLLFPVCLLILWTATDYVGKSWAVGEGSNEQSGIQAVFLLKSMIPAFAILVSMAGFALAARAGETLRGER